MFYLLIQELIYRLVNHPIKPFPVIASTAMSETKPIMAKRPFSFSAYSVKPTLGVWSTFMIFLL